MTYQSFRDPENALRAANVQMAPGPVAPRLPYSSNRRVRYGLLWAGWTAVLVIGGFSALFGGQVLAGLIGLVLGALAGRYDYRIWTWRARRLFFFIVF